MYMCGLYFAHSYAKSRHQIYTINEEQKIRTLEYTTYKSGASSSSRTSNHRFPKIPGFEF